MQFEVIPTPKFEKDLKKISKKDRNIKSDIEPVLEELEKRKFARESNSNETKR